RPGLRQPVLQGADEGRPPLRRAPGRRDRAGGRAAADAAGEGRGRDDRPVDRRRAREEAADMTMRTDHCGALTAADTGRTVALCGWVAHRREHGEHLAFVDLRDHTGLVQCVVDGAHDLRSEYVLRVTGTARMRPEGTVNPELPTGEIEVGDCRVEVLSVAEPPPFPVTDRIEAD